MRPRAISQFHNLHKCTKTTITTSQTPVLGSRIVLSGARQMRERRLNTKRRNAIVIRADRDIYIYLNVSRDSKWIGHSSPDGASGCWSIPRNELKWMNPKWLRMLARSAVGHQVYIDKLEDCLGLSILGFVYSFRRYIDSQNYRTDAMKWFDAIRLMGSGKLNC